MTVRGLKPKHEVLTIYGFVEFKRLPCFRLSKSGIYARRSTLLKWMGGPKGAGKQ